MRSILFFVHREISHSLGMRGKYDRDPKNNVELPPPRHHHDSRDGVVRRGALKIATTTTTSLGTTPYYPN